MTDTNFTENDLSFEALFKNGTCLTCNYLFSTEAQDYAIELREKQRRLHKGALCLIETPKSITSNLHQKFHYFSNGILIINLFHSENENNIGLKRILKLLEIRNLPVKKIYDLSKIFNYIVATDYMEKLNKYALSLYDYHDNIKIKSFFTVEEFVSDCFANNNILLTACKSENIDLDVRNCCALFADGRFFITNEEYKITSFDQSIIDKFRQRNPNFVILKTSHVPQEYIDALNNEAIKYDWYISADEVKQRNILSDTEIQKMNQYIENLFSTRKCISVTNIDFDKEIVFSAKPDVDRYALFSDGLLVTSNKTYENKYMYEKFSKIHNNLKIRIEFVPDYYITEIYSTLPRYQRSAESIYMEMIKEKAKKIKKELNISHHESLDIAARIGQWKNFKSIKIKNEAIARNLITFFKEYGKNKDKEACLKIYQDYLNEIRN